MLDGDCVCVWPEKSACKQLRKANIKQKLSVLPTLRKSAIHLHRLLMARKPARDMHRRAEIMA